MKQWKSRSSMHGTSLIEVLVSMVLVSFGALSMAGLGIVSKKSVTDSSQKITASQLGHALLEKMQSNSSSTALQTYISNSSGSLGMGRISGGDLPIPSPACTGTSSSCSPSQLAAFDLWLWERLVDGATEKFQGNDKGGLNFATACISGPSNGAAGSYAVAIAYRGSSPMSFTPSSDCGSDAVFADGSKVYGDNDEYRRVITLQTFITPIVGK